MRDSGFLAQFPELAALDGVPQDPHWHPEGDALTHAGLSGDHMARQCEADGITGDERTLLVLAATLHDLGKATHTHIDPDGTITSYGHDDAGVAPAHRFLLAMDAPQRFHDVIEPLIAEHMCVVHFDGPPTSSAVGRLIRRLAPATIEQWVRVVNADHGGRGSASVDGYADSWLEVAARRRARPKPPEPGGIVTGDTLIAAGLKPDPVFREILAAARAAQDRGEIVDDRTAQAWLKAHLRDITG